MGRRGQRLAMAEAMATFCNKREQDSKQVGTYEALSATTSPVKAAPQLLVFPPPLP